MPRPITDFNLQDIIDLYNSGMGTEDVAKNLPFKCSSQWVDGQLRSRGLLRTRQEAMDLVFAKRTPEQRKAWAAAANEACRNRPYPEEAIRRSAATRFTRQIGVSEMDRRFAEWLGVPVLFQKNIGRYNVDLLVEDTIAVELIGHSSHNRGGPQAARAPERAEYILSTGLNMLFIWVSEHRTRGCPWELRREAADYAMVMLERARSDPSFRGQYRVVWGDGKAAPHSDDLNDLTRMPARRSGHWPATGKLD